MASNIYVTITLFPAYDSWKPFGLKAMILYDEVARLEIWNNPDILEVEF